MATGPITIVAKFRAGFACRFSGEVARYIRISLNYQLAFFWAH